MGGPEVEKVARTAEVAVESGGGTSWIWIVVGVLALVVALVLFVRLRARPAAAAEAQPTMIAGPSATSVSLQVQADTASDLKAEHDAFSRALPGHTVRKGQCMVFRGTAIHVAAVEPSDGGVLTASTPVRMSVRPEAVEVTCTSCGKQSSPTEESCSGCQAALEVVDLERAAPRPTRDTAKVTPGRSRLLAGVIALGVAGGASLIAGLTGGDGSSSSAGRPGAHSPVPPDASDPGSSAQIRELENELRRVEALYRQALASRADLDRARRRLAEARRYAGVDPDPGSGDAAAEE